MLRPRAETDLEEIADYIAERSGDQRAASVLRRIARVMQTHADHPDIGRRREDLRSGLRSVASGRYIIFFFPIETGIRVVRVLHGARDMDTIFAADDEDEDEE